ncbi:hypothetical protein GCM10008101_03100 [Lysobacter xinjiangensis]|uniref:PDZ domain-containing protein n=1 Tax=Cognatilysobacter xinjiangensis TaxID=546892 RepID=A0ABQ3BQ50_9GAMM|nr:PDZ domain-containing protein [Lysobacter xinjiangensis]GGZ53341.1 hypothetical protein GCM10008101_03100 [Lysobacter xinjiangensis]
MQRPSPRQSLLALAVGALVAFGAAAQTDDRAAKQKELEAARAELQATARKVAALSRELGERNDGVFVFEQRALSRPVLGVLLDADASRGVRVSGVTPDSGAAKAGLRTGDRILSIDGKPVEGADGNARLERLRAMLADIKEGSTLRIGYEHDGKAAAASVTPRRSASMTLFNADGSEVRPRGDVRFMGSADGGMTFEADSVEIKPGQPLQVLKSTSADGRTVTRRIVRTDGTGAGRDVLAELPGVSPRVHSEILRLARDGSCKDGENCRSFALAEAFRWNGLNLASLDANLGRYFGTTDGVLVVSAGPELAGLQSGDVIRKVDGRGVASPREVMDALRGKPEGATVSVEYLRDRKAATAQLKVPKAMRIPLPPAPPAPPVPPAPPSHAAPAPPPPPGDAPPPPPPPAPPAAPPAPRVAALVPPALPPVPPMPRQVD